MKKILIVIVSFSLAGCATVTQRVNPRHADYFKAEKSIVVMPPHMKMYQLTAGGVSEYDHDWSLQAQEHMLTAIREHLGAVTTGDFKMFDAGALTDPQKAYVAQQNGLFFKVAYSAIEHTYTPESRLSYKMDNFDYTLGADFSKMKDLLDGDVYLFCSGRNYIWSAGRVTLSVFSALVGAATGVMVTVPAGPEWVVASLVDSKTGDIVWFNFAMMPGDMRDAQRDRKIIKYLFKDFPRDWKTDDGPK